VNWGRAYIGLDVSDASTYDLHQANLLLPKVRGLVAQIVELAAQQPELQDQVRIAEYKMRRPAAGEADSDDFERSTSALSAAERDLITALEALAALGVSLKDARSGLVDFLSWRDGELVELCWRLGEDQIEYWHPLGAGFAGREPV